MLFSQWLKSEMESKNITKYRLAKLSGVHQTTISNLLDGAKPQIATEQKIRAAFDQLKNCGYGDGSGSGCGELDGSGYGGPIMGKENPASDNGSGTKKLVPGRYKEFLSELSREDLLDLMSDITEELKEIDNK